jgi:hypothetical protein
VLLGLSLAISIGIAFINQDALNIGVLSIGVSAGISIVVTIANIAIQMIMVRITYLENEYISSSEQTNIAFKIGLSQILNSIGVPIVVTVISQTYSNISRRTWLEAGGLVETVFFVGILNVLIPIAIFIDPWEIYLKIVRWYYSRPSRRLYTHTQK